MSALLDEAVAQMRQQRHDFMNDLQVVYGYLQLQKPEHAVQYIEKINHRMQLLSSFHSIPSNELSLLIHSLYDVVYHYDGVFQFQSDFDSEHVQDLSELAELPKIIHYLKTEFDCFCSSNHGKSKAVVTIHADANVASEAASPSAAPSNTLIFTAILSEYRENMCENIKLDTDRIPSEVWMDSNDFSLEKYMYNGNDSICYKLIFK